MTVQPHGAVAAGHRLTAGAAAAILQDGGNAVDAAIAGLWTACVVEPVLAAPGGGGFMMAHNAATATTTLYDFFVQTPLAKVVPERLDFFGVHADFGAATQEFHIGHGASATPGFVPGLFAIHEDAGSRPMASLLQPAQKAARDGIRMSRFQAFLSRVVSPILTATETSRALFAPDGELITEGGRFVNPGLAGFLDALGHEGMAFYDNDASAMLSGAQAGHGHLRRADFSAYQVHKRVALTIPFAAATVALNPPPSSGGIFIAHALHGLERQDASALPGTDLATALARSDSARTACRGDAAAILAEIGIDRAVAFSGGTSNRGTTHVSVVDRLGNAAAATVSNGEGNGHVVPGCGFMLNNMLGEEDINPHGFHQWRENARLSSNMCPAIAIGADGGLTALGSGGSNRIRSAVFQVLVRMMRDGMAPLEAVNAPRAHVEEARLDFEDDLEDRVRAALVAAFPDHRAWPERNLFFGGVHAVHRAADGSIEAAGDPRRAGTVIVV